MIRRALHEKAQTYQLSSVCFASNQAKEAYNVYYIYIYIYIYINKEKIMYADAQMDIHQAFCLKHKPVSVSPSRIKSQIPVSHV